MALPQLFSIAECVRNVVSATRLGGSVPLCLARAQFAVLSIETKPNFGRLASDDASSIYLPPERRFVSGRVWPSCFVDLGWGGPTSVGEEPEDLALALALASTSPPPEVPPCCRVYIKQGLKIAFPWGVDGADGRPGRLGKEECWVVGGCVRVRVHARSRVFSAISHSQSVGAFAKVP